ncbi:hypothetical protein [Endozoicomonas sp. GU-1]|uniref:hypothetical protein n=1 Tax=Endozoicomonas sp. GU-1 TaxID=3009078 RepID=UPI0022B44B9D|nr:hypothetical protein [Endozoicomonas sp. GU-1]WBA79735.1 hypothetical protein O2T12_15335 [Endozoicomonas sp. GU-1]WBA87321.1 hypothetical protein O3276_04610 [Endozoicomonas sp. GU-1]
MDRLNFSQLNPVPNCFSNIQGTTLAESGATGQAFSRMVTEVEQSVTNHDITEQSTSSDHQGDLGPKKKWLKAFAVQNQTNYKDSPAIPVAIPINPTEPPKNDQPVKYDPENNPFSIYSLTKGFQSTSQSSRDVNTKLNPPIQIPNQDGIGNLSKSKAPIAIIIPRLQSEHHQQDTSPAIQTEEAIDENPSHIECQRELHKDPAYAERNREHQKKLQRERQRKRYQTDPAYAQRERERKRKYQRERYQTDPAFVQRKKERQRELRKDPAYVQHHRERQRELRKDPAYVQRERQRARQLRKDPAYNERKRELCKDPAYAESQRDNKKQCRQSIQLKPGWFTTDF